MTLYGRPTAAELAAAVEDFLRDEVMPALDGRLAFQTRVAANAIAMIGRELEAGPGPQAAQLDRLATLGVRDDAELAAAIRAGAMDERMVELLVVLRASVEAKVAVANPRHTRNSAG